MDSSKKLVRLNVITSGGQVVFIGLIYFLLYRYLLSRLGVEMLGVWSVVLSTSSLATLANFGVADSVVRFVALYSTDPDNTRIKRLIFTASLFLFFLFLLIACLVYPFADLILKAVLPAKFIQDGLKLLPYSLACLIINSVNGVYASVLDGLQKNYIRNAIFSISSLLLLIGSYILVPEYQLVGVAFAQLAQSVFTMLVCLSIIMVRLRYNPFKWDWDKTIFKQIFSYGLKFQFISLSAMLNEPITKILLGKFGGMAFAGYYEMANRLLMQARGVLISATQSLVPVMVNLPEDEVPGFYKKIFSNVLFFSLSAMSVLAIGGRSISFLWIGNISPVFCNTLIILAVSLFINLLSAPAYFYYMASGDLNKLIRTHLILGVLNAIFAYTLGYFLQGYGVIYGWFFAVLISSWYMIAVFDRSYKINFGSLIKPVNIVFTVAVIMIAIINRYFEPQNGLSVSDLVCLLIVVSLILFLFFKYQLQHLRVAKKNDQIG